MARKTASTVRDEYPSPWVALARNDSVVHIIDALLELPSHREFNQSELAEMAGVSRNSVGTHIDLLVELEIVAPVEGTSRYQLNVDSGVTRALVQLEDELNKAAADSQHEQVV